MIGKLFRSMRRSHLAAARREEGSPPEKEVRQ